MCSPDSSPTAHFNTSERWHCYTLPTQKADKKGTVASLSNIYTGKKTKQKTDNMICTKTPDKEKHENLKCWENNQEYTKPKPKLQH